MRTYAAGLTATLTAAQEVGIEPVYFVTIFARHRTTNVVVPFSFWTGDENITLAVETETGGTASRSFIGGVNLTVDNIVYVADLTDNPVTVGLSQIADTVQDMVRGHTVRFASCLVHGTTWTGGVLSSTPQLLWVGVVDAAPITTPDLDADGGVVLSMRSELMNQLMIGNSAKSSDSHQKRRQAGDGFSKYSGSIDAWKIQWYKG